MCVCVCVCTVGPYSHGEGGGGVLLPVEEDRTLRPFHSAVWQGRAQKDNNSSWPCVSLVLLLGGGVVLQ